jgi:gamma-glutamyltranspeptidase/glutathione hydrolase
LTNVLDFEMSVQQAIDAPRWESTPGTDPGKLKLPFQLRVEAGFEDDVLNALQGRGHRIASAEEARAGAAQMIMRGSDGVYSGGSDPRADGCALGF